MMRYSAILKDKISIILLIAAVLTTSFFLIISVPLFGKVNTAKAKYHEVQGRLDIVQKRLDAYRALGKKVFLISETDVSPAMDEMERAGKTLGVQFVSIKTGEVFVDGEAGYSMLPIQMELVGSFESLGNFLGSLDSLKGSFMTVYSFNIARHPDQPLKVKASVGVYVYVANS